MCDFICKVTSQASLPAGRPFARSVNRVGCRQYWGAYVLNPPTTFSSPRSNPAVQSSWIFLPASDDIMGATETSTPDRIAYTGVVPHAVQHWWMFLPSCDDIIDATGQDHQPSWESLKGEDQPAPWSHVSKKPCCGDGGLDVASEWDESSTPRQVCYGELSQGSRNEGRPHKSLLVWASDSWSKGCKFD